MAIFSDHSLRGCSCRAVEKSPHYASRFMENLKLPEDDSWHPVKADTSQRYFLECESRTFAFALQSSGVVLQRLA